MKIRTFGRHTREAFKHIGRNGWMTFASVSAVTTTLLLVGAFLVIMMNLNELSTSVKEDVQIKAYIDLLATEDEEAALKAKIKRIAEVESVTYSSKDQELENLIQSFGEEGASFQLYEQDNPLYAAFIVKAKVPEDTAYIASQIETFNSVADVKYGQEIIESLFTSLKWAKNIGIGLIIALVFTAMFLISNTIKITIIARKREIEIMKLVGATNGFIRAPFFIEGLILGVLGSILPIAAILTSYHYIYKSIAPKLEGTFFTLLPLYPFAFQIAGLLVTIGAFIGMWGSTTSVRKFLKV
ncbi:cell division protein FtsX [Lottiidibacillus patelloidae]|uniref:Cell division protein FtsX n=1 Tax=Lottiidibacillus patelloidae TaxID=2670334 RepID=A0A263BSH9_9BACI|nr:permease-like cell division protein FtsX [Lottiidibacillus patelloidae]OZM56664.1 cell division protein FtsX [Lottiidibacillus patelloidae]